MRAQLTSHSKDAAAPRERARRRPAQRANVEEDAAPVKIPRTTDERAGHAMHFCARMHPKVGGSADGASSTAGSPRAHVHAPVCSCAGAARNGGDVLGRPDPALVKPSVAEASRSVASRSDQPPVCTPEPSPALKQQAQLQPPLSVVPRLHRDPAPEQDNIAMYDEYAECVGPIGNEHAWTKLSSWFRNAPTEKLVVLTGPTGVGKSFAVHSCARANGFDVTELSGSEKRDAATLKEFMGQMAGATLRKRILLLDDADCMEESSFAAILAARRTGNMPRTVVVLDDYWCQDARPLHGVVDPKRDAIRYTAVDASVIHANAARLTLTSVRTWRLLNDPPLRGINVSSCGALVAQLNMATSWPHTIPSTVELPQEEVRLDCYVRLHQGLYAAPLAPRQRLDAEKLAEDVHGDLRQFRTRRSVGGDGATLCPRMNIYEQTEYLFDSLHPPSCADAESMYWTMGDMTTPMMHENLVHNATDIDALADSLDGLCTSDTWRYQCNPLPETAALVAMLPGVSGRRARPTARFATVLKHIKDTRQMQRRRVADANAAMRAMYLDSRGLVSSADMDTARGVHVLDMPNVLLPKDCTLRKKGAGQEPSRK